MKIEALERLLAPTKARLAMLVARAVVQRVNDALKMQGLQVTVLAGEVRDEVERFQQYGFTSHPHQGAEAVLLSAGGNRDHGIVVAVDDRRYRLKGLPQGEVALYSDITGQTIILRRGGEIEIRGAEFDFVSTGPVTLKGTTVTVEATSGNLVLKGATVDVDGTTGITADAPSIGLSGSTRVDVDGPIVDLQDKGDYKGHLHSGVNPGGGQSGPVV